VVPAFQPRRVVALFKAKGWTMDEYLKRGFSRFWLQRTTRPEGPKPQDAVRLAAWLEVPMEYLYGGAPEYRRMKPWEVAAHASLDLFFKRHADGKEALPFRRELETHQAARRERIPKTIEAWAGAFDIFQSGRARERADAQKLEGSVSGDPNTSKV